MRKLPTSQERDAACRSIADILDALDGPIDLDAVCEHVAFALGVGRYTQRKGVTYRCPPNWVRAIIREQASRRRLL